MTLHSSEANSNVFTVSLLALITAVFYYPLLGAWFLGDDTQWMWFSAVNPLWKIFFDSDTYLYINDANFTPMLGLSFKVDWNLFHMNPVGYNVHTFLSLWASSVMLYLFLRLFAGRISAFFGSLLFIVNPAAVAVVSCHSNRHYMEGMFWALLSLYLFFRNEKESKPLLLFFSVCAYLLSSLSKEVYLILPALMFIFINGDIAKRTKITLPFWIALLVYLVWRWFMLGGSMGGYYFIDWSLKGLLSNVVMAVILPVRYVYGTYWPVFPAAVFLISVFMLTRQERYRMYMKASAAYLIALVPVIPVMAIFLPSGPSGGRYAFHVSTVLIILATLTSHFMKNARVFKIVLTVLFFCTLFAFYQRSIYVREAFVIDRKTSQEETVKFLSNERYLNGVYPPWFYDGLGRLYGRFYGKQIVTGVFYEDALKYHERDVIESVKGAGATPYLEAQKAMHTGPLDIEITWNGRSVRWMFGPEEVAFYHLLLRKEKELYYLYPPVKRSGSHFFARGFADNENIYIRILYRLPDGTEVVSPEIKIFIPGNGSYQFKAETRPATG